LFYRLDPFSGDIELEGVGERHDGSDDRLILRVLDQPGDKGPVDLQ
jgi:hypothetical protein